MERFPFISPSSNLTRETKSRAGPLYRSRNKDAKEPFFGVVWFSGRAITDRDAKMVNFTDMKVDRIKVPQSTSEQEKQLTELLKKESANWMPVRDAP